MKKEWFDKLSEIDKANETIIGISELRPYLYNRTLLYGYTCERETFHVYLKDQQIYTVVYNTDYSINYEKELGSFMRGDPKPKNMRQIEVKSNSDFVPNKRLYPERCDYHFCRALKERRIDLPFTHWNDEIQPNESGYYGFILEDIEETNMKVQQTYNPCDDCKYSYSKNNQESRMCKICEFTYFRNQTPKEGEWLNGKCSACGSDIPIKDDGKGYTWNISDYKAKYCPNCGARMK